MKGLYRSGSGMSGYRYASQKTVWRWTPAKIAAFSMFGIMMAALLYFESTSSRTAYGPVSGPEKRNSDAPVTDFEKQYQEFLKSGTKIVTTELPTPSAPEVSSTPAPEEVESKAQASNPDTFEAVAESDPLPENLENNLKTVELIPAPKNEEKEDFIGVLEEINPDEYDAILNSSRDKNEASAPVITEEFFVEETISGRIYALSNGAPMPGVSIVVNGTDISTVSDSEGRYTITVPGDPERRTVRYSYQGNTTERDIDPGTSILNIRF